MCGITGVLQYHINLTDEQFAKMAATIAHRGTDDQQIYSHRFGPQQLWLAHYRLAIIDPSTSARQPMHFEHLSMVYNGAVYNFQDLQKELSVAGYQFTSQSDTEVVLKAFHYWGIECFQKLNGMFAIAIFNHQTEELFLVRDRIGIKPLYYYQNHETVIFASQLKPIIAYPNFSKNLNFNALGLFLAHGYITAPQTIFQDVQKLLPGHIAIFHKNQLRKEIYWDIKKQITQRNIKSTHPKATALNAFNEVITTAVQDRLIADVPVGCFLSGGYDSSLIAAIMQQHMPNTLKTFTIGFQEKNYNEAIFAEKIAQHLKTDHHQLYLNRSDALELITQIPSFFDEPLADSSQIPTMLVSQLARKQVKVVLTGDGGDELFTGYSNYEDVLLQQKYIKISQCLHTFFAKIPGFHHLQKLNSQYFPKIFKLLEAYDPLRLINLNYIYAQTQASRLIKNLVTPLQLHEKYFEIAALGKNLQESYMLKDLVTYLPDDILVKVDRSTMAVALESRIPFLDPRVLTFAWELPHHWKFFQGEKKYLLKQLVHRYLPVHLMQRPKQGFTIPILEWLKTDLSFLITKYLNVDRIQQEGFLENIAVQQIIHQFQTHQSDQYLPPTIWYLIIFQMWVEKYL